MFRSPKTSPRSGRWSAGRGERAALALLAALSALAAAGAAAAGTPSCSVSTGAVSFGSYDATTVTDNDSSGYIDVQCTCTTGNDCTDLPYSLEIQAGASGSLSPRRMERSGGTETLDYGLYQDSGRTTLWGVGANALGRTYGLASFDTPQRSTVYGRVPAHQYVIPGTYGETPAVAMIY